MRIPSALSCLVLLVSICLLTNNALAEDNSPGNTPAATGTTTEAAPDEPYNPKRVYKTVDKSGKVTYSSAGDATTEKIDVRDPNSINLPYTPHDAPVEKQKPFVYESLVITSPEDKTFISGVELPTSVNVSVAVSPALNVGLGHKFKLYSNGAEVGEPSTEGAFTVSDLYRGSYTLRAVIIDNEDNELITSDPVVFNVYQPSMLLKKKKSK